MLWITNNNTPVSVAANSDIPFNSVICSTNDNAALSNNAVNLTKTGWYTASINAILSATDATTTTIQLYEQGNAINNAAMTVDIPANGTATISFEWPIRVVEASTGYATVLWKISTAAVVDDIVANIKAIT